MKDITSTEIENSPFKREVLETSVCQCGQEYDSRIIQTTFGRKREVTLTQCSSCYNLEEDRKKIEIQNQKLLEDYLFDFKEFSLLNPKLMKATFESYEPTNESFEKVKKICERYTNNFEMDNPVNLLLLGNYGTGKSHLAISIAKDLMYKKFKSAIFVSTPKLLTKIRSSYNRSSLWSEDEIIKQLSKVALLVLDDIGSEQAKPTNEQNEQNWATSKIFEIMDNRIGKHTIFTTNFTVEELQERVGGRNFSRMMENTHVIKMYGDDYRLRNFK